VSPWVLGLWCIHSNEADSLLVLQDEGISIYNSSNSSELRLAFPKLPTRTGLTKHLVLRAKLLPCEHSPVAVVASLFSVVMAAVGVEATTMGEYWQW